MCTHGQGNTLNSVLYEAWADCAGDWTRSKLYMTLKDKHSKKRQGKRVWLTFKELVTKFGESAEDIVERKLGDADLKAKEVRPHPDAPDSKDYNVLSVPLRMHNYNINLLINNKKCPSRSTPSYIGLVVSYVP